MRTSGRFTNLTTVVAVTVSCFAGMGASACKKEHAAQASGATPSTDSGAIQQPPSNPAAVAAIRTLLGNVGGDNVCDSSADQVSTESVEILRIGELDSDRRCCTVRAHVRGGCVLPSTHVPSGPVRFDDVEDFTMCREENGQWRVPQDGRSARRVP
jgi:hypothetical protein